MDDLMFNVAADLSDLRKQKKDTEDMLAGIKEAMTAVNEKLVGLMIEKELQNFVLRNEMFYLNTKTLVSAVAEKKEELYAALKAEGYGDLVQETVNSQTLGAFVRDLLGENDELPDWIKDKVAVFDKTEVGVRKA
jgi:hypothetical protein